MTVRGIWKATDGKRSLIEYKQNSVSCHKIMNSSTKEMGQRPMQNPHQTMKKKWVGLSLPYSKRIFHGKKVECSYRVR